jgi:hypothetical protein
MHQLARYSTNGKSAITQNGALLRSSGVRFCPNALARMPQCFSESSRLKFVRGGEKTSRPSINVVVLGWNARFIKVSNVRIQIPFFFAVKSYSPRLCMICDELLEARIVAE